MEYNNVGVSHTGHRDVFITSDEMHLTASFNEHAEMDTMQERTYGKTCARTSLRLVGDKDPFDISYSRHRKQVFLPELDQPEFGVGRSYKGPRVWEMAKVK
jgi:hypothetical protein